MKKKAAELEKDVNGHVVMSLKNLEKCCEEEGLYATPELNDKLYLHFKGFHKIDNLLRFTELKALWLNNNAITTIENLSYCRQMVTLYLNNNIIKKIEGLDNLELLCILNLSHNRIERIEGLASLRKLNSLAISHNLLTTAESLEGIGECPSVANLDLSNNEIECQEEVLTLLSQLPELAVLYLKNTPLARGFKNYRKRFVSSLEKLKFLDERPVNSSERRLSQAWSKGGTELENVEKSKLFDEREAANRKNYDDFEKLAGPPRERRRKLYEELGSDKIKELEGLKKKKQVLQGQPEEEALEEIIELNSKIGKLQRYLVELEEIVSTSTVREGWKVDDYKLISTAGGLRLINLEEEREKAKLNEQVLQQQQEKFEMWGLTKQGQQIHQPPPAEQFKPEEIPMKLIEEQEKAEKRNIMQKWDSRFEPVLELLLEKNQFDFDEVFPEFNMAVGQIYKKLGLPAVRFEAKQLRQIWTFVEKQKRNHLQDLD